MATRIEKVGRRFYLRGLPFEQKDIAKSAGCRFDPAEKAWWTGKEETANDVVKRLPERCDDKGNESVDTSAAVIKGRAKYKGKTFYVLAEGISGRTGKRYAKLAFRDGSKTFWVKDFSQFTVVKQYWEPKSIDSLRRFAEKAKNGGFKGSPGQEYCYGPCPVGGFKCCPENGPCHDCE